MMKYAINVPNFGEYGHPRTLASLAQEAEASGWDGFFVWDHLQLFYPPRQVPVTDPWIALAAVATSTTTIKLGPMITPLARRRPWKVARETVALDHLSDGRLILGVGLGTPPEEYSAFGEVADPRVLGDKLDEGLDVLTGLWSAEPFVYVGRHYAIHDVQFTPPPLQTPRIPIWVAGTWPNRRPLRRAARFDGVFPFIAGNFDLPTPDQLRQIVSVVHDHGASSGDFVVTLAGQTPGEDPDESARIVASYAEAGLTWWQEAPVGMGGSIEDMRRRIRQGPPRY
jgi:alkanesulfonate monooxygenase SsuD/methylene tetrahydromethanopterin reductase-like flavin-dependent oxidoreductase (luciferase family)